ncbi:hypothetical protein MBH78_00155 [Oceanimonas sp. NS1]|nr:hypothetical protein [Oceanimonas sp. NS1]
MARLLKGPWPLIWGAVALALLNYATLALAGRPWGSRPPLRCGVPNWPRAPGWM